MVKANKFARGKRRFQLYIVIMPGTAKKFRIFAEAEKAGRDSKTYRHRAFLEPGQLLQLGRATRIDRLTRISGVSSDETFASKAAVNAMGFVFLPGQRGFDPKQRSGGAGSG
jgi:hypothetical protein